MDVLIIGGTGCLSYAIVNEALQQGHHVTCVNRGKSKSQILPKEVEILIADYHKRDVVEEKLAARHFDVAIDCLCFSVNDIDYSVSLLKDKCDQYMFISSCAVYKNNGVISQDVCREDAMQVTPIWSYSVQKAACEKRLADLSQQYGFSYTTIRPAVTYGNTRIPYGITPPYGYHGTLIHRLLQHKPIILWNEGKDRSTITRVEDFAVGVVGLFGVPKAHNEAFSVVGDENYSWLEVINTTASILGVKPVFVNLTSEQLAYEIPARKGEILGGRVGGSKISNDKLKSVVPGFKTTISLQEGIAKTIRYYLDNDCVYGIDYNFDGDWDRIAAKYDKSYKPRFIDYLGTASPDDESNYEKALATTAFEKNVKNRIRHAIGPVWHLAKRILMILRLYKP